MKTFHIKITLILFRKNLQWKPTTNFWREHWRNSPGEWDYWEYKREWVDIDYQQWSVDSIDNNNNNNNRDDRGDNDESDLRR